MASRTCPTGQHPGDQFVQPGTPFAATAVFRAGVPDPTGVNAPQPILEFHNPLAYRELLVGGASHPLAADLSAPLIFQQATGTEKVDPFAWFIHPEMGNDRDGLFFLEPYQPGKIPVVLIHGLLSSPTTWAEMANELRNLPGFSERFQIWGFRYATGRPFVTSAALLRRDLSVALHELQGAAPDAALDHVVLIGHSMGGLIAKAQVSSSEECLWRSIANRPISEIVADQQTRDTLCEQFFFLPQPSIRRVVFVAVPHGGSTWATRLVGQVGSCLVTPPPAAKERHRQLIADNPGVFSREVSRRIPTSIDLLESSSGMLQALHHLPVSDSVKTHSIIGNGRYSLGEGRGDGIVGIKNAQHPGVASELLVPTTHTEIHRRSETICEVWRILSEHYQEYVREEHQRWLPAAQSAASAEAPVLRPSTPAFAETGRTTVPKCSTQFEKGDPQVQVLAH